MQVCRTKILLPVHVFFYSSICIGLEFILQIRSRRTLCSFGPCPLNEYKKSGIKMERRSLEKGKIIRDFISNQLFDNSESDNKPSIEREENRN